MKAAIVTVAGKSPVYGSFDELTSIAGAEVTPMSASALSQFKSRSSATHYEAESSFPAIAE